MLLALMFSLLVFGTRYLNYSNKDDKSSAVSRPLAKSDLTNRTSHNQKFERFRTTGGPILDFTIRTWRGDGHWLIYCLRSIEMFVPKAIYRTIIITYDERDDLFFKSFLLQFQATLPLKITSQKDTCVRPGPNQGGYYSTMWSKYHTDLLSDADYFIHVDSDTIFNRPVSLNDFVDQQYRVYVKKIPFAALTADYLKWKTAAQELLDESVTYETMTRFPFVYPRDLYTNIRKHIEQAHKKPFLQVARTTTYFSDHSTFGAYLVAHMAEQYVDYVADADEFIYQSWSWVSVCNNR
jgi:hypothetical protein